MTLVETMVQWYADIENFLTTQFLPGSLGREKKKLLLEVVPYSLLVHAIYKKGKNGVLRSCMGGQPFTKVPLSIVKDVMLSKEWGKPQRQEPWHLTPHPFLEAIWKVRDSWDHLSQ